MKTITTKMLGVTATRPTRIKAFTNEPGAPTITRTYNTYNNESYEENCCAVAKELMEQLGWTGTMVGGSVDRSGDKITFVFRHEDHLIITR